MFKIVSAGEEEELVDARQRAACLDDGWLIHSSGNESLDHDDLQVRNPFRPAENGDQACPFFPVPTALS